MITYRQVSYHEDEKVGIVYFFNESRMAFCKDCPIKETGKVKIDEDTTLINTMGCPCETLRTIASGSISLPAFRAIRDANMLDELLDEIKKNDMPIGGVDVSKLGAIK